MQEAQAPSFSSSQIIDELQSQLREYKNIVRLFKDQSVSDQKIIEDLGRETASYKGTIV